RRRPAHKGLVHACEIRKRERIGDWAWLPAFAGMNGMEVGMRTWISAAVLALALGGAAAAQVALDSAHPRAIASILNWRGEEQATGFRTIEKIFKTQTIRREHAVHP